MDLCNIRVCERVVEWGPIFLVFCDAVLEAGKDGFVESIGLSVCLRMVRSDI